MIERWFLFGTFIFFPAMGLVLFLAVLSLVRYWAEYNADSAKVMARIRGEIEAKKAARRPVQTEYEALEPIAVEASAEAKAIRSQEREYEVRKKAMEKLDARALATLVKTMIAKDEPAPKSAIATKK